MATARVARQVLAGQIETAQRMTNRANGTVLAIAHDTTGANVAPMAHDVRTMETAQIVALKSAVEVVHTEDLVLAVLVLVVGVPVVLVLAVHPARNI